MDIIKKLSESYRPSRFSELQPKNISNNVFSYHLKQAVDFGYVIHANNRYTITRKGMKTVSFSGSRDCHKAYAVMVSALFVINDENKVLLIKRSQKPFAGWYGIPSGIVRQNETLQEAAKRELSEKAGIDLENGKKEPEFAGILDYKYHDKKTADIFIHGIALIYKYKCNNDKTLLLNKKTPYGELDWSGLTRPKILPEVYAIRDLIANNQVTIKSVDFEEPES